MEPTSVGILRLYIQVFQKISCPDTPALAGIYGWYIHQNLFTYVRCKPATAGIYGWYIHFSNKIRMQTWPATAGIYG